MSNDDEKLNKESQMNVGIYAIRISLYNNLGKPVDLNSKMFVFPDGASLTSELNNHPYLSSNIFGIFASLITFNESGFYNCNS